MNLIWNEMCSTHLLLVDDDTDEVMGHVIEVVIQWTPSCRFVTHFATSTNSGIEYTSDDDWRMTPSKIGEFANREAAKRAVERYVETEG